MDISEKSFEASIEEGLLDGGYRRREPEDYDRATCLDPGCVTDFVFATQPQEWEKLKQHYGAEVKQGFLRRLTSEVAERGTLDVLRKGIRDRGSKFQLAYFRPVSGLNEELQRLCEANQFTVIRQLKHSETSEKSVDLALFLNGLPIFTAELKNPLTGQNVRDAMQQYRFDRDRREALFEFGRCLAHFAVDADLAYMTTKLAGPGTRFLPFNQGHARGAGNPPLALGYSTAYLWEHIWAPDSVLNLVQHFVCVVEEEDDKGRKTGTRSLIFPRYHQLDCVRRLIAHARETGPGERYLIQHSAGSGKSNSIAWLAHQLSVLHDDQDERVFDSSIVITDRRVLDRQLQRTVSQFEQVRGVVENIDQTSRQLKEALESGKTIIVTTLQKFPVIVDEIQGLSGSRFAVIVDEAHSSQTGESTKSMKQALSVGSLEEAEQEEGGEPETLEDRIVAEMQARGPIPNVSTFAFTATPKPKTLELFGTPRPDGKFEAFSLYTMRQAIEEGFILDVLQNYTTYKTYWSLLKKIEDDPHYDQKKATYLLRNFVELHEHNIARKVGIMMDHFAERSAHRINGKAKAMIVTRSRLHAVRYKQAVDRYLEEKGYPFKALVAFSGIVRDKGMDYTEAGMNGFPEAQTAEHFKRDENRIMVVAEKFQTGFDQPFLHTMYVDKKLGGVHAVQTLSRLNRILPPDKEETMVLDFANDTEEIQKAFEPYYDRTILTEATDPNLLYDKQRELEEFQFYSDEDVDCFAEVFFDSKATQDRLYAALEPVLDRYEEAQPEEQEDFRGALTDYVRLYAFLSQIITFADADLEKLYVFGRLLLRRLPVPRDELPREVLQNVDMESYRVQQTSSGAIALERTGVELEPRGAAWTGGGAEEEIAALSEILKLLNERFGTDFTEEDQVFVEQLEEKLARDAGLSDSLRVNTRENARLTFNHVVSDRLQEMVESNFKFYKQVTDDAEFAQVFLDWLFGRYCRREEGVGDSK